MAIGNYNLNLNSREIYFGQKKLKLTEKEISSIAYLFKAEGSVNIQELQSNVWGYQSELETHTVETHIYRLRKKILKTFNDGNFIVSRKRWLWNQKNKFAKDLFSKKYKPRVVKPKKGKGSFKRRKS